MKLIADSDLIVGAVTGDAVGIPAPADLADLPLDRLRLVDGAIIDAATLTTFYIDDRGRKRAVAGAGWQALDCAWDDVLVRDADTGDWRIETDADQLAVARADAIRRATALTDAAGGAITAEYSSSEMLSWSVKEAAARAVLAGTAAAEEQAMIDTEAAIRSMAADQLATLIITKADEFRSAAAALAGQRSIAHAAITDAADQAAIDQTLADLDAALDAIGAG